MRESAQQPHPLSDLLLTVILPSVVLEFLSAPERLGPAWALVVALLLPVGFGIYCWVNKRGLNFFSIFGLIAIIVTGGLGLLNLTAGWFALKETVFPIFLGLAFPLSHRWGKPLINELLLNPQLINYPQLHRSLNTDEKRAAFEQVLYRSSWSMAAASILAAGGNALLALYLLKDRVPASEEYVKAIGKLNWGGMIVIGLPLVAVTFILLMRLLRRIQEITGLPRAALLNGERHHTDSSSSA
jgi:hypothetical protein